MAEKGKVQELLEALDQLSEDMHMVSRRPCETCKKMSDAPEKPFGCYEYLKEKERG